MRIFLSGRKAGKTAALEQVFEEMCKGMDAMLDPALWTSLKKPSDAIDVEFRVVEEENPHGVAGLLQE